MSRKNKPTQQACDDRGLQEHNRVILAWLKKEVGRCQNRLEKIQKKIRKIQRTSGDDRPNWSAATKPGRSCGTYHHDKLNFFPLREVATASASKPVRSMSHHPRV